MPSDVAGRSERSDPGPQPAPEFESIVESAEVRSRDQVAAQSGQEYDPVGQSAEYAHRVVRTERSWETTIRSARQKLLETDAREIYLDFLLDLKRRIEQGTSRAVTLANLLRAVAIRGLGMTKEQVRIHEPRRGGTRWQIELDASAIATHLENHIVGSHFLNWVTLAGDMEGDNNLLIGGSDVSQHRSAVPIPARFFKRSAPFVLNNAAGTIFSKQRGRTKYDNLFNPKPDEALLRWMLIDPSYQDELEPEDYARCVASAMDVGHYKFDHDYLMDSEKRPPNTIFRDGSLFPQDAYLDNFVIENKRGEFTREAIRGLFKCLNYAKARGIIYCGISKSVQLKVYSAIADWFIERYIDDDWGFGSYTLNDGQQMSLLLAEPSFGSSENNHAISTCLIKRSFTTRANLNTRADLSDLHSYFQHQQGQNPDIDIALFQQLCDIAHLYMFFIGHSKNPQLQLPRYEFFYDPSLGSVATVAQRILAAVRSCGLMNDEDHSFMADRPVTYLIPSVTQQAHYLSKDVGRSIDRATGQLIMARYTRLLR